MQLCLLQLQQQVVGNLIKSCQERSHQSTLGSIERFVAQMKSYFGLLFRKDSLLDKLDNWQINSLNFLLRQEANMSVRPLKAEKLQFKASTLLPLQQEACQGQSLHLLTIQEPHQELCSHFELDSQNFEISISLSRLLLVLILENSVNHSKSYRILSINMVFFQFIELFI